MKSTHKLITILAVASAILALPQASLEASFLYEAVEFELIDPNTPDLPYTISGTFETDCNDCLLEPANLVGYDLLVSGPDPFNFLSISMGGNSFVGILSDMVATPTELLLLNEGGGALQGSLFLETPVLAQQLLYNTNRFDDDWNIIFNQNPGGDALVVIPGMGDLVIGTFVPEPTSAVTALLGLLGILGLRRKS